MNFDQFDEQGDYDYFNPRPRSRRQRTIGVILGVGVIFLLIAIFAIRGCNNPPELNSTETVIVAEATGSQPVSTTFPSRPSGLTVYAQTTSRTFFAPGSDFAASLETPLTDSQYVSLSAGSTGISLYHVLRTLADFEQIDGAYYDAKREQLVIVGHKDPDLPPIDPDDAAIAFRAVLLGNDNLGITIVPTVDQLAAHAAGQSVTGPMNVQYFGQAEFSHFGQVMYEADRYLKDLSTGLDENGEAAVTGLDNYEAELSHLAAALGATSTWYRLWFTPAEVFVNTSLDEQAMWINQESPLISVEGECVEFDESGEMESRTDQTGCQAIDDFADFLEAEYEQLAVDEPALHQLKQLLQLITVARWIRDYNIPFDASPLLIYPLLPFDTPTSTEAHSYSFSLDGGVTINIFGGVDFSRQPDYQPVEDNAHPVNQIMNEATSAKVGATVPADINGNQVWLATTPARMTDGVGSLSIKQVVVEVGGGEVLPLRLELFYDSLTRDISSFGPGWQFTPVRLALGSPIHGASAEPSDATAVMINRHNGRRQLFRLKRAPGGLVEYQLAENLVEYDTIVSEETLQFDVETREFIWHDGQATIHFDEAGRYLREVRGNETITADWDVDTGNLIQLTHNSGNEISLSYFENTVTVRATNGQEVTLQYDGSTSTIMLVGETQPDITFSYAEGRLAQINNRAGATQTSNYDERGLLTKLVYQFPNGSQRLIDFRHPTIDPVGESIIANRTRLPQNEISNLGINSEQILSLGISELVLSNEPLSTIAQENGTLRMPLSSISELDHVLTRLIMVRDSCTGGCNVVNLSLERDVAVGYSTNSSQIVLTFSDGREMSYENMVGIEPRELSRLADSLAANDAGVVHSLWAYQTAESGQEATYVILKPGEPEIRLNPGNLRLIQQSGASADLTFLQRQRNDLTNIFMNITQVFRLTNEPGVIQEPYLFSGPTRLAQALNLVYGTNIVPVSLTRTPLQAMELLNEPFEGGLPSVEVHVGDSVQAENETIMMIITELSADVTVVPIVRQNGRETLLAGIARENMLFLYIAHTPDGSQIEISPQTEAEEPAVFLTPADIEQANGHHALAVCNASCGIFSQTLIAKGGKIVIGSTRQLSTLEAAQFAKAFVQSLNEAPDGATLREIITAAELRLFQELGDQWKGFTWQLMASIDEEETVEEPGLT